MLNTKHYTLLAGNPTAWDDELTERVKKGERLGDIQAEQYQRGFRSAILVHGMTGWYVRSATAIDGYMILLPMSEKITKQDAVEWGKNWANQDPANREFFAVTDDLHDEAAKVAEMMEGRS